MQLSAISQIAINPQLEYCGVIFKKNIAKTWPIYGGNKIMVKLWQKYGKNMVKIWLTCGKNVVKNMYGKNIANMW